MKRWLVLLFMCCMHLYAADEPELHLTENDRLVAQGMVRIANTFFTLIEKKNKKLMPKKNVGGVAFSSYWAQDLRTDDIDPNEDLGIMQGLLMRDTTLYCRFGAWCFAKNRMVTGVQFAQNSNTHWEPLFLKLSEGMKNEIRSIDGKEYAVVHQVGELSMPELMIEKKEPKISDEAEASSSQSSQIAEQPIEKKKMREQLQSFLSDVGSALMSVRDLAWWRQEATEQPRSDTIEIKRLKGQRLSAEGVLEPLQPEPVLTFEQKERIACWQKLYREAAYKEKAKEEAHHKEVQ